MLHKYCCNSTNIAAAATATTLSLVFSAGVFWKGRQGAALCMCLKTQCKQPLPLAFGVIQGSKSQGKEMPLHGSRHPRMAQKVGMGAPTEYTEVPAKRNTLPPLWKYYYSSATLLMYFLCYRYHFATLTPESCKHFLFCFFLNCY